MSYFKNRKQDIVDLSRVLLITALCGLFSYNAYKLRDTWPGIAPAPSAPAALFYGYGDKQLAYRNVGMILQNAGDTGGRVTNFKDYDYSIIEEWLWLSYDLDMKANYVPSLAAYYFSAAKESDKLNRLIDYLAKVGEDEEGERWRWLGHAIYLARFGTKDQDKALELAEKLAAMNGPDMPMWTKVMPAYVQKARGDKKSARDLLLLMLADPSMRKEQANVNQNCWYINEYLREADDGLDQNEIFKDFCTAFLESEKQKKIK